MFKGDATAFVMPSFNLTSEFVVMVRHCNTVVIVHPMCSNTLDLCILYTECTF